MPEYTLYLQLDESATDLSYYRRAPTPTDENAGYDLVANESWSAATTGSPAIREVKLVDALPTTARGAGGFGSTG